MQGKYNSFQSYKTNLCEFVAVCLLPIFVTYQKAIEAWPKTEIILMYFKHYNGLHVP